jgi:hypothetical protein
MTARISPTAPTAHSGCRDCMIALATADGVDIIVSTAPPLIEGPYGINGFTCPHGTTYWIEPSSEQIAQWRKDGTP